jgi:Protein of unknown function (DUF2846)
MNRGFLNGFGADAVFPVGGDEPEDAGEADELDGEMFLGGDSEVSLLLFRESVIVHAMYKTFTSVALSCLFLLCLCGHAQDVSTTATVHFYRYKQFEGSALKPSIYCDGVELIRMQNGRFFDMQLPLGEHTCYANDKQAGAIVKFEAGKDYYFRVNLQTGMWKGHYRLEMVMPEQGKYDIAKLKPLDKDKIVVSTEEPLKQKSQPSASQ